MSERMPSLGALRAFEAAARHLSLTRAAEELHVTPAAVSHQIKVLEDDLGIRLFDRENRRLSLTTEARAGLDELRRGFDLVTDGVRRIRESRASPLLRVTSETTFAGSWLVPRLADFRAECPDLDVLIDASDRLADFERGGVDIGIRWGGGNYPGLVADKLFGEEAVFPVCHPSLLEGKHGLREPGDLVHHTLIHLDWPAEQGAWPNWRMWLDAAGVDNVDATRGLRFTAHSHAIRATMDCQGVVMATLSLVGDDLRSGALARPFDLSLAADTQMYLVYRPDRADEPAIKAFRDWALKAAQEALADWT